MEEAQRFIRLTDGSIYRYSDLLATRRDASVVDGYTAAQYLRAQGVDNDITEQYPSNVRLGPDEIFEAIPSTEQIRMQERISANEVKQAKRADQQRRAALLYEDEKPEPPAPETSTAEVEGSGLPLGEPLDPEVKRLLGNGEDGS